MAELDWHNLRSSNVARAAFDSEAGELLVEFVSGATYAYPGQSESTLDDLVTSSSPGSYVAKWLKHLPARRVSCIAALALLLCGPAARADEPLWWTKRDSTGFVNTQPESTITIVVMANDPTVTVCFLKAGSECLLEYDGKTQTFTARRPWNVIVEKK